MPNATWLADVLREELKATPFKVVEEEGWQTRGRPGALGPVKGVILHHTGSNPKGGNLPALGTVKNGRGAPNPLPGPLSQLMLARDGTWHVIAAGRCNHAGAGKWQGVTAGNSSFLGVEAENNGAGEVWPEPQLESYALGVAAILRHIGADEIMAVGHREYALPKGRKVDPSFDTIAFREHLDNLLRVGTTKPHSELPVPTVDPVRSMLFKGATGPSVKKLEQLLNATGDYKGKMDSDFGPKLDAAVRAFQKRKGLDSDGKVGPKTWAELGVK